MMKNRHKYNTNKKNTNKKYEFTQLICFPSLIKIAVKSIKKIGNADDIISDCV